MDVDGVVTVLLCESSDVTGYLGTPASAAMAENTLND